MKSRVVFFVSERGWKITKPLRLAGWSTHVIVCKGNIVTRSVACFRLILFLLRHPKADIVTDTPVWIGLMTWVAALIFRRRYLIRLRGDTSRELVIRNMPFHKKFFHSRIVPDSSGLIPVSDYLKIQLIEQFPDFNMDKISVIPTPQNIHSLTPCFEKRAPVLLVVTTFRLKDKVSGLFSMLPELDSLLESDGALRIKIVGHGNLLAEFQKEVSKLKNSDRIVLAGFVSNITPLYCCARALLHISDLDAYPSVVNEARGAGLPVIVSNSVGMPNQVTSFEDGIILDKESVKLYHAWQVMSDEKRWTQLSVRGKRRVASENNSKTIGSMFASAFLNFLN